MSDADRCRAVVYRMGPYRSAGRRRRFEREPERGQCKRRATVGHLCAQHAAVPNQMVWAGGVGGVFEFHSPAG